MPMVASASETVPQCALNCEQQLTDTTSCSNTDTTCLCDEAQYQKDLSNCAMANCSMKEALTAKYIVSRQCDLPMPQRYPEADPATIIPFVIATILFAIRMVAKSLRLGGGWGPDDYTIIAAYALAIIAFALNISMVHYGFGMNIWDIVPQDNITIAYKYFFAFVLVYKALISLAKISVCLFLLRIFQSTAFRYTTYTMIAINTAVAITWILTDSFHCIPVHLAWTGWAMEEQGTCINFIASTFANGFVNIVVDTVMVIMPVYEVSRLNLSVQKKVGVAVMLGMGLVLTAIGIIRVVIFSQNTSNTNPTFEMEPLNHWSVIECQMAIICACLPTSRALFVRILPSADTSHDSSTARPYPTATGASSRTAALSAFAGAGSGTGEKEKSLISKRVSYSVDVGAKAKALKRESDGFIQLKDIEIGGERG
ncbi:CFEM domain-containing protein [Aspergillus ruber CBS 135680]|uniref:Integral membrane protein n=1 Tax=Aspergillus ruber (strain CBS 135680) TaxID=1388766 RepID=A0A017SC14_ASPRC|nr:uncharacterized protein EURHEDRAFT_378413 [Aspergillus ruber CBS 135680]EYE94543.1 integral membrane protein [Aspergillus ruber CBS 135680]